jgi:hypothetical protein
MFVYLYYLRKIIDELPYYIQKYEKGYQIFKLTH